MTIEVSRAGISGTDIKPDTPEWCEWFETMPQGTKIQFVWTDDAFRGQKFTAYRRKRYWEAQKRVSGRLRNATIKPGEVTYEALRMMGLRLTAYNWADKFEIEESGKGEYQTFNESTSQTQEEIAQLTEEVRRLGAELSLVRQMRDKAQSEHEKVVEDNKRLIRMVRETQEQVRQYEKNLTIVSGLHRESDLKCQELESLVEVYQTKLYEGKENGRTQQPRIIGIDLEEFYDAVILDHPPRERKLIGKAMTRFKTLIVEALTRRGVPVR
jgi:plasmid stabilization system protein ParE